MFSLQDCLHNKWWGESISRFPGEGTQAGQTVQTEGSAGAVRWAATRSLRDVKLPNMGVKIDDRQADVEKILNENIDFDFKSEQINSKWNKPLEHHKFQNKIFKFTLEKQLFKASLRWLKSLRKVSFC